MTELLRAEDVAKILNVDTSTIYRMAADGRLPAIRLSPKITRFDPQDLETWIHERRTA